MSMIYGHFVVLSAVITSAQKDNDLIRILVS